MIYRCGPGMRCLNKCLLSLGLWIWTLVSLSAPPEQTVLVYVHSPTCGACAQFDREVGAIYHKTEESALLPLQQDLSSKRGKTANTTMRTAWRPPSTAHLPLFKFKIAKR
jgi:hypothetical protein